MSTNTAQTIADVLLSQSLISESQLNKAKQESLLNGKSVDQIIRDNGYVTEEEFLKAKAQLTGTAYVDPYEKEIQPELIKMIPQGTAEKYNVIPISKENDTLTVAMTDPEDLMVIQYLQRSTGLKINPILASASQIKSTIEREYSKTLGSIATQAIEQAAATTTKKLEETLKTIDDAGEIIKVSPVAKVVSILLEYAVKASASDIHIEPYENGTRLRYRIDGELQEKFPLPKTMHDSVVARIKILANMPIDEKRIPLDGKFKAEIGDTKTDLRVSTMPTIYGEKVVIRLLKDQRKVLTLRELGLWGKAHQDFKRALYQTTGIIFVTGPTGSGKTVTQATSLAKLNSPKVNIITLEDPVEITIAGVNQIQINTKAGLTFASGLRSVLRQDPDIVMVGEVRDQETARLAIQASLTGHLVLATLHTNSAAGTIPRLKDMGIESYLIASTLNVSLAQRLVKRVCEHCKEEYEPDEEIKQKVKKILGDNLLKIGLGPSPFVDGAMQDDDTETHDHHPANSAQVTQQPQTRDKITLFRGKGCEKCNHTGYKGRMAIYEVMNVSEGVRALIEKTTSEEDITDFAIKEGMITLAQDGYLKALWGITTLDQVLSVADENADKLEPVVAPEGQAKPQETTAEENLAEKPVQVQPDQIAV